MNLDYGRPKAWSEGRAKFWLKNRAQAIELVRWINLLPHRLLRNILRMPDSHSRAGASSYFPPLPSFQPADVSHPDRTILLQTAHLLASQSIWPSSISGSAPPNRNAGLFTTWAHSHKPTVIAVSISRLLTAEKRSYCLYSLQMTNDIRAPRNTRYINVSSFHIAALVSTGCWLGRESSEDLLASLSFNCTACAKGITFPCNWCDRLSHLLCLKSGGT